VKSSELDRKYRQCFKEERARGVRCGRSRRCAGVLRTAPTSSRARGGEESELSNVVSDEQHLETKTIEVEMHPSEEESFDDVRKELCRGPQGQERRHGRRG